MKSNHWRGILSAAIIALMLIPLAPTLTTPSNNTGNLILAPNTPSYQASPQEYPTLPRQANGNIQGIQALEKIDSRLLNTTFLKSYTRNYGGLLMERYNRIYHAGLTYEPVGLLLKIKDSRRLPLVELQVEKLGGKILKYYPQIKWLLVAFPEWNVEKATITLSKLNTIEKIVPDTVYKPQMYDINPMFDMASIHENLGLNGTGILVSILDTGVDPTHPAIPQPAYWKDFIANITTPYDEVGHGTHVAGILLGRNASLFPTGDYMWHSVLVGGNTQEFNPTVRFANLTYKINVTNYQGLTLNLSVTQMYTLNVTITNTSLLGTVGTIYFRANATILYRFNNTNWAILASMKGNQTVPTIDNYTITVPAGAGTLYLEFRYEYYYLKTTSSLTLSDWLLLGWFIDSIALTYNNTLLGVTVPVYADPVANATAPLQVINQTWWVRTRDKFTGIAPNATLAAGKVCSIAGCPASAILDGMNWSLSIGADIVSMSLGAPPAGYDPLAQMADYLVSQGVIVVVAAGNTGPSYYTITSPGTSHLAITVGAATKEKTLASFSATGPSIVDFTLKPDVVGVGYDVISAVPRVSTLSPNWSLTLPYVAIGGTSMATPMVAGIAALIKEKHPTWTPEMVKSAIISTADFLNKSPYLFYNDNVFKEGGGLVDPHQAINATVLPMPANVYVGYGYLGINSSITNTTTLLNTGNTTVNMTVVGVKLYWANTLNVTGNVTDYTSLLEAPYVGENFTLPAGGSVSFNITVNLSYNLAITGLYGGYIVLKNNRTGETIHVIFDLYVANPIHINGTVVDYSTGKPVSGALVTVYSFSMSARYSYNTTNSTGWFDVIAPANKTLRIIVSMPGYFEWVSYSLFYPSNVTYGEIDLVPIPTRQETLLVIDKSANWTLYGSMINQSITNIETASEEMNLPVMVWNASDPRLQSPGPAIASGVFSGIVYLGGGGSLPVGDVVDYDSLMAYAIARPGFILLSGSKIGLIHGSDPFMTTVAHAYYTNRLSPADYTVYLENVTILNTLNGFKNYIDKMGTPENQTIGQLVIKEAPGIYVDTVAATNNGTTGGLYNESVTLTNTSIVVYYGRGLERAITLYLAFDMFQLNDTVQEEMVRNLILSYYNLFQDTSPKLNGKLEAVLDGMNLTIYTSLPDGEGINNTYPLGYMVTVSNQTATLETLYLTQASFPLTLNLTSLGVRMGDTVAVNLTTADYLGRILIVPYAYVAKLVETSSGDSVRLTGNTTIMYDNVKPNIEAIVEANGTAILQVSQLKAGTLPPYPTATVGKKLVLFDVFLTQPLGDSVSRIVLKMSIPSSITSGRVLVDAYWFNGVKWVSAGPVSVDEANRTVSIVLDSSSSPSLGDLSGTPILLAFYAPSVGGLIVGSGVSGFSLVVYGLAAVVVLAGVLFVVGRRKRK